jgi:hypothetical protein
MTDQADRERESRESDLTKFEEQRLDEEAARDEAAERLETAQEPDEQEP